MGPELQAAKSELWIARLTLAAGLLAALPLAHQHNWHWGTGVLVGAILAWLNFVWLRRGMDALVQASVARAEARKPEVPVGAYAMAALRYVLIALAVYVIFEYLHVPVLSMIVGLCALGAATMAVSVYEIFRPAK
jgi:hypothetical protein